jgi:hypothetical protein
MPWLLLLVACGGDAAPPRDAEQANPKPKGENMPTIQQMCDAHCDRAASCGAPDLDACRSRCIAQGRETRHLRGDFVWRLLSCLDQLECPSVVDGSAFSQCFHMSAWALPLTPNLRAFCFESARKASTCGRREDADQAACRDRFRHLNEVALARGLDCLKMDCAAVPGCFKQSFGM